MGKYLLENVHAQFPHARCSIVVASRGAMIRDLFAAYPWLEVIEVNRRSPRVLFSLFANFYGSDLVVTQYAGKKGGKFGLASKLAARILAKKGGLIGFNDTSAWNGVLYDRLIPVRRDKAVVEHDRQALRAVGLSVPLPFPTLEFVRNDSVLGKFNLEKRRFVVVHLFSGNKGRGLHPDKKRELLTALAEKLPDTRLVISGGTADREEALRITENLPATVIAGETTLQELMNLIAVSRSVVSVDTGVAHISAQLRKPLVVLSTCLGANWWLPEQYGKDAPVIVFSRGDLCAGGHNYKEYPDCMNMVDMQEVAQKVLSI